MRLVLPDSSTHSNQPSSPLLKAIVMAHGWKQRIVAGQIYSIQQLASEAKLNSRYAARILRLATLSPEIVEGVIHEGPMPGYSLSHLITSLPLNWHDQGSLLSRR